MPFIAAILCGVCTLIAIASALVLALCLIAILFLVAGRVFMSASGGPAGDEGKEEFRDLMHPAAYGFIVSLAIFLLCALFVTYVKPYASLL